MKAHSLRVRITVVTMVLMFVVLAVVLAALTVTYGSHLRSDLRRRVLAAGSSVAASGSENTARQISSGLALQGIATTIDTTPPRVPDKGSTFRPPTKTGASIATHGDVLSLTERLADGAVSFAASEGPIDKSIASLLRLELAIGLAGLAAALGLVVLVTRLTMRPLARVVDTASALAAGDASQRLAPDRTDTELGAMAAAFDRMVDSLQQAAADARAAEATMSRFVADAAHELRTPVAALQATAERLLREQPERPERDELEAAIAAGAMGLGHLVGDLLSVARLDAAPDPSDDIINLAALAEAATADARRRAPSTTVTSTTIPAVVQGDADALQRTLRNLLDNAITADPSGSVVVNMIRSGDQAVITVQDNGPGIPDTERERIFEPFARLPGTTTPGTGLGLAIARGIARQHGGELRCEASQRGALFVLSLPVADERGSVTSLRSLDPDLTHA